MFAGSKLAEAERHQNVEPRHCIPCGPKTLEEDQTYARDDCHADFRSLSDAQTIHSPVAPAMRSRASAVVVPSFVSGRLANEASNSVARSGVTSTIQRVADSLNNQTSSRVDASCPWVTSTPTLPANAISASATDSPP